MSINYNNQIYNCHKIFVLHFNKESITQSRKPMEGHESVSDFKKSFAPLFDLLRRVQHRGSIKPWKYPEVQHYVILIQYCLWLLTFFIILYKYIRTHWNCLLFLKRGNCFPNVVIFKRIKRVTSVPQKYTL